MEIVSLSREYWEKWNQFCIQSDDAWFWHTTWWLEYSLEHKPELLGSSKSFFITDGSRILAICPLIVETHENQGVGHKEFSYSGSYGIAPATSNELSEKGRRKILRLLFDHIDSLAMNNHVERMSLRCSPLSPSYSIASAPQSNWLMRYNLMDVSLNTQVIDLDDDPKLDAVTVTKQRAGGTKHVGIGHDGTSPGKRGAIGRTIDKLNEPSNYIEASGAIENILRKANVAQVTDEETIRKALKGKEIKIYDDGSYDRILGGKKYRKTMWGKPTV